MRMSLLRWLTAAGLFWVQGAALALPAAGEIMLVTGRGTISNPVGGAIRDVRRGDQVYSGEIISSATNSYINIKFSDGSFILLRPNTRFQIQDYQLVRDESAPVPRPIPAPEGQAPAAGPKAGGGQTSVPAPNAAVSVPKRPGATAEAAPALPADATAMSGAAGPGSRAFFRIMKGGFRAVSGLIGKVERNEYRVDTPVATIGIRGTDYVLILCDAACRNDPVVSDAVPEGSAVDGGVIVGVISGGVAVLNRAGQEALLKDNDYLINLPDGTQIRLPFEPRFLRVDPIPNPTSLCE